MMIRSTAILLCLLASSIAVAAAWPERISGMPSRIVDGDTIHLDGHKIRLLGIDTPEMKQYCQDRDGVAWPCGIRARDMLVGIVNAGGNVECNITGRDRYQRLLGQCYVGKVDVQHALIAAGFGVAEYTKDYIAAERKAKRYKLGIWAGTFERPRIYRKRN